MQNIYSDGSFPKLVMRLCESEAVNGRVVCVCLHHSSAWVQPPNEKSNFWGCNVDELCDCSINGIR